MKPVCVDEAFVCSSALLVRQTFTQLAKKKEKKEKRKKKRGNEETAAQTHTKNWKKAQVTNITARHGVSVSSVDVGLRYSWHYHFKTQSCFFVPQRVNTLSKFVQVLYKENALLHIKRGH
jgi:hypothetical protein